MDEFAPAVREHDPRWARSLWSGPSQGCSAELERGFSEISVMPVTHECAPGYMTPASTVEH